MIVEDKLFGLGVDLLRAAITLFTILICSGGSAAQVVTLAIDSDPSGILLTGSGTPATVMSLGTVQAFGGTVPSGITKTTAANSWTLSTPIDIQVTQVGTSTSYQLTAQLTLADPTNTWRLNAIAFSTTATTITSSHAYGTAAYSFSLTIPFSAVAGSIINTVDIIVTAN